MIAALKHPRAEVPVVATASWMLGRRCTLHSALRVATPTCSDGSGNAVAASADGYARARSGDALRLCSEASNPSRCGCSDASWPSACSRCDCGVEAAAEALCTQGWRHPRASDKVAPIRVLLLVNGSHSHQLVLRVPMPHDHAQQPATATVL